jgi:hypothetical protein
MKQI